MVFCGLSENPWSYLDFLSLFTFGLVSADDATVMEPLREKPSSGYHRTPSPNNSGISHKQPAASTSVFFILGSSHCCCVQPCDLLLLVCQTYPCPVLNVPKVNLFLAVQF